MTSPLVTADWLRNNLDNVLLFDANYHLPTVDRDPGGGIHRGTYSRGDAI